MNDVHIDLQHVQASALVHVCQSPAFVMEPVAFSLFGFLASSDLPERPYLNASDCRSFAAVRLDEFTFSRIHTSTTIALLRHDIHASTHSKMCRVFVHSLFLAFILFVSHASS